MYPFQRGHGYIRVKEDARVAGEDAVDEGWHAAGLALEMELALEIGRLASTSAKYIRNSF